MIGPVAEELQGQLPLAGLLTGADGCAAGEGVGRQAAIRHVAEDPQGRLPWPALSQALAAALQVMV